VYDWLLARRTGGKFILRIEDTDRNRFVPDSLSDIMASMKWLGLDWDEGPEKDGGCGPYFQSERLDIYKKYADQLLAEGKAYYCYCSSERLQAVRQEQEKTKQKIGYDRHCRDLSEEERKKLDAEGGRRVIRFKTPLDGTTVVKDAVRGDCSFDNSTLEDLILIKSDGFPTYHFANIVDDHLMKISHVLRGDEWIASSPVHVLLYQVFGWEPPVFAHLSIFLSPDGGKLSKRHGATSVKEYREQGYLPEALLNFLLLLGWNPGTDRELFTMEEAAKEFSLERVNASPVKFSTDKLAWFNGMYIRSLSAEDLAKRCLPFIQKSGLLPDPCPEERFKYLVSIIPLVQERLKLLTDAPSNLDIFLLEDIETPEKKVLIPKKMDDASTLAVLDAVIETLEKLEDFSVASIEHALRDTAQKMSLSDGHLFMPIRSAISGRAVTPGIFESLNALGKARSLKRIRTACEIIRKG
jgi:glutamyl-tRNA synthetase